MEDVKNPRKSLRWACTECKKVGGWFPFELEVRPTNNGSRHETRFGHTVRMETQLWGFNSANQYVATSPEPYNA